MAIDAMACRRGICRRIIDREADYVIGLKGSQGRLRGDVEPFLDAHLERGTGAISSGKARSLMEITGELRRAAIRDGSGTAAIG